MLAGGRPQPTPTSSAPTSTPLLPTVLFHPLLPTCSCRDANVDAGPSYYEDDVGRGCLTRLVIDLESGEVSPPSTPLPAPRTALLLFVSSFLVLSFLLFISKWLPTTSRHRALRAHGQPANPDTPAFFPPRHFHIST